LFISEFVVKLLSEAEWRWLKKIRREGVRGNFVFRRGNFQKRATSKQALIFELSFGESQLNDWFEERAKMIPNNSALLATV